MREQVNTVARIKLGVETMDANYERVAKAASTVGIDKWYLPCNAFLSKFAHPTSLLVVGVMHLMEFQRDLQVVLTAQGVIFARESVAVLSKMTLATPRTVARSNASS